MRSTKMFDAGARACSKYINWKELIYVCPICLRGYTRSEIDKLRREHAPQESIGGRIVCLTCENCNHKAGHGIEMHLKRRQRVIQFAKATSDLDCYEGPILFESNDILVNGKVIVRNGEMKVHILPSNNHPVSQSNFEKSLVNLSRNQDWDGHEFKVHLVKDGFNQRKATIADLKSAYLLAFAFFGYGYILSPGLNCVREQIMMPEKTVIENFAFTLKKLPSERALIKLVSPISCLAVQIDERFIFLPYENSPGFYEKLGKTLRKESNLKGQRFDYPREMQLVWDN